VQTTLLGLGIAIILALLTALVGPYFVNWTSHRAFFEGETSRMIGAPVRIGGPIEARLLPVPSVKLENLEIRLEGEPDLMRARSLDVEFSLGALLRGELRAVEMRVVRPELNVRLNGQGHLVWPATVQQVDALTIDRLTVRDGIVGLTDAASGLSVKLDNFQFAGDVRSFAGPVRGDGTFTTSDGRFSYRVSAGRYGPEGMRIKLGIDTVERPLTWEAEGTLTGEGGAPKFDGAILLSRAAGTVLADGNPVLNEPWRLTAKLTASPHAALLDQLVFQYGPDDRAARLGGAAEFKFGAQPNLRAALSSRQMDLDRLLATTQAPLRRPLSAIQALGELIGPALRPSLPVTLAISVDSVTLGGATLQGFGSDLRSDGTGWHLQKLELRAPGFTQVNLSGRLSPSGKGLGFSGGASVDSNDSKSLFAWLSGASPQAPQIRPWNARGDVTLNADRIAVEHLKLEFERSQIEGKIAYQWPAAGRPARLETALKAGELDLDAVSALSGAAGAGVDLEWPREIVLALDIDRARLAGLEGRNVTARMAVDAKGISVERISVGDLGQSSIEARGRIETEPAPSGGITVDLDAREFAGLIAVAEKFAPGAVEPLRKLAARQKTARVSAALNLSHATAGMTTGRFGVTGRIGPLRVNLVAGATGKSASFAAVNWAALADAEARLDALLEADDGGVLLELAGVERIAGSARRPGRFSVTSKGLLGQDLRFESTLNAGAINAEGKGAFRLPADRSAVINLEQFAGTIEGTKVQGQLAFQLGEGSRVDGAIEADLIDASAAVAAAIGMRSRAPGAGGALRWSAEPFVLNEYGLVGRVAFKAKRATFNPEMAARPLQGVARFGTTEVAFEDVEGELAKGRFTGRLAFARSSDGLSAKAQLNLADADVTELLPSTGRPPITGRLTLKTDVEGSGLSPAAFIGSLNGSGTISLAGAQFAHINPKVFDAVIRAVDLGIPTDNARIRDFVTTALDGASLSLAQASAALQITAGQVRLSNAASQTEGAKVTMEGRFDLNDTTVDALLTVAGVQVIGEANNPTVSIALKGPLPAPRRSVDASQLAGWLAMRAVEQQSQRLDAIERAQRDAERPRREPAVPAPGDASPSDARPSGVQPSPEPSEPPSPDQQTQSPSGPSNGDGPAAVSAVPADVPRTESPRTEAAPPLPAPVDVSPGPGRRATRSDSEAQAAPSSRPAPPRQQAPRPQRPGPPLDLLSPQR